MTELAVDQNGNSYAVPAAVTAWRVKRMKPRGAPELVYGADGRPLTVAVDATVEELRELVPSSAKYRLDPTNDQGQIVEGVPAGYVYVQQSEMRNADGGGLALSGSASNDNDVVREALRQQTALAQGAMALAQDVHRSTVEQLPEVMRAAADMMRVSSGLPTRAADGDEEDAAEPAAPSVPGAVNLEMIQQLVAQIVPIFVSGLASKGLPKLAEVLDWRKAAANSQPAAPAPAALIPATDQPPADERSAPAMMPAPAASATPSPANSNRTAFARVLDVQAALSPAERTLANALAMQLSPADQQVWLAELAALPLDQAVAKVRATLTAHTGAAA